MERPVGFSACLRRYDGATTLQICLRGQDALAPGKGIRDHCTTAPRIARHSQDALDPVKVSIPGTADYAQASHPAKGMCFPSTYFGRGT